MTFSILAHDSDTGAIGGAAATGSYCVGGWVLRGALDAGMSASQGASPSTFWGDDVLTHMRAGQAAATAVDRVVQADAGRDWRQLSALDLNGGSGAFTGAANTPAMASQSFDGGIAAGNLLISKDVVTALADGFQSATGAFALRLIKALHAAEAAGGDSRGLLSAAVLVLSPRHPPISLRIDYHADDPIGALRALYDQTSSGPYADWLDRVPIWNDRQRGVEPE